MRLQLLCACYARKGGVTDARIPSNCVTKRCAAHHFSTAVAFCGLAVQRREPMHTKCRCPKGHSTRSRRYLFLGDPAVFRPVLIVQRNDYGRKTNDNRTDCAVFTEQVLQNTGSFIHEGGRKTLDFCLLYRCIISMNPTNV